MWEKKEKGSNNAVIDLQVLPQPLVLLKEEVQSELQIEVNLGGERDQVGRAQVPAVDTHHCNDTQARFSTGTM